jgi:uncharacterized membrane protein
MAKRTHQLILIGIFLLGLILRLINLNQSFWLDEATQGQLSILPVSQIWSERSGDFHPPLYYLLIHYWATVSHSEIWLRLPSVLAGVLTIWVVYKFSKQLFPKYVKAHYLSAFLLAIAPFHIYYSQEFRSYSLLCLLATVSMFAFYQKKYWQTGLANTLLIYTHYSGFFLIVTQLIYWIIYDRQNIKQYVLSHFLTLLIFMPWLPQFSKQLTSGIRADQYLPGWTSVLSIAPLKTFPVIIFKIIAGRINFLSRYLYGVYIVFVFAVTFTGIFFADKNRKFLLVWGFLPIFLLMTISLVLPQAQPFRIIYILPGLILLLTQACLRFPKLFITMLIYISIVGNITYFTRPRLQREQWRQAITYLRENSNGQTKILVKFSDRFSPFYWYAPDFRVDSAVSAYPATTIDVTTKIKKFLPQTESLYVLDYLGDLTDPSRVVDGVLKSSGYEENSAKDFPGVGIIRQYQKKL